MFVIACQKDMGLFAYGREGGVKDLRLKMSRDIIKFYSFKSVSDLRV